MVHAMGDGLVWLVLAAACLVVWAVGALFLWLDRGLIAHDLAAKGCVMRRARWLPLRRGLTTWVGNDPLSGNTVEYGRAFRVWYTNRDGAAQVAVCLMGPEGMVFWTDEHPEPGFDRHGNPPNLPTYGQSWRG